MLLISLGQYYEYCSHSTVGQTGWKVCEVNMRHVVSCYISPQNGSPSWWDCLNSCSFQGFMIYWVRVTATDF